MGAGGRGHSPNLNWLPVFVVCFPSLRVVDGFAVGGLHTRDVLNFICLGSKPAVWPRPVRVAGGD